MGQYLSFCDWLVLLSIMSSRLAHVVACDRFPSFLRLNNCPLYVHFTFSLSSLDGPWAASTSRLLWIMFQWTWLCKYLHKTLLSIISDIYPEVELLDHMAILFLDFWGPSTSSPTLAACLFLESSHPSGRALTQAYLRDAASLILDHCIKVSCDLFASGGSCLQFVKRLQCL